MKKFVLGIVVLLVFQMCTIELNEIDAVVDDPIESELIDEGTGINFPLEIGVGPEIANYYLSPNGSDANPGTKDEPFYSLNKAWAVVSAGDLVYMRGGTYTYTSRQTLSDKSGTSSNPIQIFAYPGEQPLIQPDGGYTNWRFIYIDNVDYLHLKGIEIGNWNQKESKTYRILELRNCENCTVERVDVHDAPGSGLNVQNCDNTLILNCDFYRNNDPLGSNNTNLYGNADGIAIKFTSSGKTNTIRGCRMWWNSDDGLDLWKNEGKVIIEDTWAFWNGFQPGNFLEAGDGIGLKLGRTESGTGIVNREISNCLIFQNKRNGLSTNNYIGDIDFYNNTIYQSGYGGYIAGSGINFYNNGTYNVKNNISYDNAGTYYRVIGTDNSTNNSWDGSVSISDADFASLDPTGVTGARQADGSLPDIDFLRLISDSDLIDRGKDVGLPYEGSAPDLGAFESK